MDERLPEGWMLARLGDVVFPGDTRHPKTSTRPDFLYVDIEALDNSLQKIVAPKKIPSGEAPGRARLVIHTGDVIFSLTRPYLKNIAIVPPELDDQVASTAYCVMRPENGISSQFIFYLVTRDDFINSIATYGDSPPAAHDDEFLAMEIPVAPTNEQNRIVAAIEQQFTRLDNAVASLQSAKARAKQYRASLLKAAVEGELTKEWQAAHPTKETGAQLLSRILAERRARWEEEQLAKMRERGITPKDDKWKQAYKEPPGPDVEQLLELPEGWCWATVEQVSYFVRYGSSAKTSNDNTGVPVLRMGNIQDGTLDFNNLKYLPASHSEFPALLLKKGDLLFNRTNSAELVGKSAVYRGEFPKCSYASYLICLRLLTSSLADFLCFYINSHYGRVWINSVYTQQAGQANVNGSKLQALAFPLPPLAEQEQIVSEVEAQLSNIAQMEETIEISLKRAEHERQSILREAFAGRLVPQNPADEPASVLLERIREERKRREEDERAARKSRKDRQMAIAKKRKDGKTRLYATLVEAARPLPPDDLFRRAGLKVDDQPESVEDFYEELQADVEEKLIAERRPDYEQVLLEALEPSAEALACMREEEAATRAREAEQDEKPADAPVLWDMELPDETP